MPYYACDRIQRASRLADSKHALSPIPTHTHLSLNVQLCRRLRNSDLEGMPYGFPYHYTLDPYSNAHFSYESYEFFEELRGHTVKFRFSSAMTCDNPTRYFSWRIFVVGPQKPNTKCRFGYSMSTPPSAIADVQVDPAVINSPYGKFLRKDPRVILQALATSIELGVMVTITLAYLCTSVSDNIWDGNYNSEAVVFLGTFNDGRTEIIHKDECQ